MINDPTIDEEPSPGVPQPNALMAPLADPFPQKENALLAASGSEFMRPVNALYSGAFPNKKKSARMQPDNALYSVGIGESVRTNPLLAFSRVASPVDLPVLADIALRRTAPTPDPNTLPQDNPLHPQGHRSSSQRVAVVQAVQDLGRLVRERRVAMRLSQQEFADLSGVGRRFVSELEQGKPTLEIAKVLIAVAAAGIDLYAISR